jgi:GT2 family glycosyltransferase
MSNSAIAIITFNRLRVLQRTLKTLSEHVKHDFCPIAIFDDASNLDNTVEWLQNLPKADTGRSQLNPDLETDSIVVNCYGMLIEVFLGQHNLGVAGNSNRAIRWFEKNTTHGHLFLMNDDLIFYDDAVHAYAKAHEETGVGLFCLNNLQDEDHRWIIVKFKGHKLKSFRKMTGAVMSMTRDVVKKVGYFDTAFGKFGEEHCDYTNRARFLGFVQIEGHIYTCLDVEWPTPMLDHQSDAMPTVNNQDRETWGRQALEVMRSRTTNSYKLGTFYLPFSLRHVRYVGCDAGFDRGIPLKNLPGIEAGPVHIVPFE